MTDGMNDREGGYIKAHRQWESSAAVSALTAEGEVVWLRLLFATNWKDTEVILRTGPATVKRGQALISERTLAERARVGRRVVRTALATLTRSGSILIEQVQPLGRPKANLITVLKYEAFQGGDEDDRPKVRPKPDPSPAQDRPDQKKGKKGKKLKKDHGGVGGTNGSAPLLATAPVLPPDAPPLAVWLSTAYPDVTDPVGFARRQAEAHPTLDLVAEAKKAIAWETSEPANARSKHGAFLSNWFNNADARGGVRLAPASASPSTRSYASPF